MLEEKGALVRYAFMYSSSLKSMDHRLDLTLATQVDAPRLDYTGEGNDGERQGRMKVDLYPTAKIRIGESRVNRQQRKGIKISNARCQAKF
jgi:hypothetical protein